MKTQRTAPNKLTIPGQQGATRSLRYPALLLILLITLLLPTVAFARDKSGVSPQVISLPSGPGSLEGLGETFEPNLSTGTASYPVKFTAAPGRLGFQPEISLNYDGGNSNGPWGMGWRLSIPSIQRRTENGLPSYRDALCGNAEPCHDDSEDQFIFSSGEKLIPLSNGTYRFENESTFMRFRRIADGGWEAHTPDGIRYLFGETGQARVTNDQGIFRWELERVIDTFGNEMRYVYLHDGGYAYPHEIRYNFGQDEAGELYNAVVFNYEPRPDTYTDRRSGAPIRVGLRGTDIQMWAQRKLVRAYQLTYEPERSTGVYSLLINVVQVGDDGESPLPPHTFTYTQFDATAHRVVTMQNPPPVGLTNPDAELVDINADGLPDLVYTPANGEHRFYLNRGNGRWQPEPVIPAVSPAERLSNPNVRMADMDGDGRVDLLVKAGDTPGSPFYYYTNKLDGEWEQGSRVDFGPAPAFNLNDPDVQLIDVNNDHRIDVVLTAGGRMKIWLAREGAWSQTADFDVPAPAAGDSARFSDPNIKVGDMTGDRMQDLIFVRNGLVVVWPHNGNGSYDEGEVILNPPTGVGDRDVQILMGDLNNDGLVDLVLPGNRVVYYWLSLGDGGLTDAFVIENTPAYDAQNTAVRLADIDGDGAVELVYSRYPAPENEVMQYVDFSVGAQPFLLASVDNGLGRTIRITYKSSVEDHVADWDRGNPWEINLPFPIQVVAQVAVHDANSGEAYTIDYHYRDGFYDGVQMEFRGFARSEEIKRGDDTAATTVTRLTYDVGMEEESRKGQLLATEVLAEGGRCAGDYVGCFRRTINQVTTRVVINSEQTHTGKPIAYSYVSQTDTYIHEQLAQPVHLRESFEQDDYGNRTQEFNYGIVCGAGGSLDVTCGNDEVLKYIDYAYHEEAWLLNRPMRERQTDAAGNFVSEVRYYYDGEPYIGLPLGQIERGGLTRRTESLGPRGENRFVPTVRQRFDPYGNVVGIMNGNGFITMVEYDALTHTFPVVERLHLENGKTLSYAATYHPGFGKAIGATDYNGNAYAFAYDTFGRLSRLVKPGDTLALPTEQYTYQIGSPRSSITVAKRIRSGEPEVLTSVIYYDGLGRQLQVRRQAKNGQVVVTDAVTFNARQSVRDQYLPYFDSGFEYKAPSPTLPHTTLHYDPLARVVRTVHPDGAYRSVIHQPLAELHYDEEDNRAPAGRGPSHHNTPLTLRFDGLDRLIASEEINIVNGGAPERYVTRFEYDRLGNLIKLVDAQGNVKLMEYDAHSRKLRMVDPNKGEMVYTYDDAGNLIRTQDANNQIVHYTYDGANRLLAERWEFTNGRAGEVYATYHYDDEITTPDNRLGAGARNTQGRLAFIEDQAGSIHYSYDARGNIIGEIRSFADERLRLVTRREYDALERVTRLTYPDGSTLDYHFNERGLLQRIPGFVGEISYTAPGQRASVVYTNGVNMTYEYDPRLRLKRLHATHGPTPLQDLTYLVDGVNNIVAIDDGRPDRSAANDHSQTFTYDSLYRLLHAAGAYGQIDFGYDSIGNLVRKDSTVPDLALGELRYGENGAGPYALTSAAGVAYSYDANGNLVRKGETLYQWDPRNQLVAANEGDMHASYTYDAEGKRVRQQVRQGTEVTTTLYAGQYAEVRGNQLVLYIFDQTQRLAQVSLPLDRQQLLQGFNDPAPNRPLAGEQRWYLSDHLGGASLLVNPQGQVTSEVLYYPYGQTRYERSGDQVRYRFTGKELDASGLYYYESRYYDPVVGRFLSVDPLYVDQPEEGLQNPQLLNLYAYAANNPIRFVDPDGKSPKEAALRVWDASKLVTQPIMTPLNIRKAADPTRSTPDRIVAGVGAAGATIGKYAAVAKMGGAAGTATTLGWIGGPASAFAFGYTIGKGIDHFTGASDKISSKLARTTVSPREYPKHYIFERIQQGGDFTKQERKVLEKALQRRGEGWPQYKDYPAWLKNVVDQREQTKMQQSQPDTQGKGSN